MAKSLNALGKLNAALNGPKPTAAKYPFSSNTNGQAGSGNILLNIGSNSNPSQTQSKSLYPGVTNLKQEPYSPALGTSGILGVGTPGMGMGSGGMSMGPITPDSTGSSSDWNFNNLHERAAEYVQAPLWGDGGVGTYMG
jgi:hypothetical protein